jgi:hypothetical protein
MILGVYAYIINIHKDAIIAIKKPTLRWAFDFNFLYIRLLGM